MITPRKAEINAIAAIIDSDEYESSEQMAYAVIKETAGLLSLRDTYGIAAGFEPGPGLAFGPYYDARSLQKALIEAQQAGLTARKARLTGVGHLRPVEVRSVLCECGHRVELHPKSSKCLVLPTCHCKAFTQAVKE